MELERPKSMSELVYYTRRADEQNKSELWVFRGPCPKCGKGLMGKPVNPKTGKVMSRADEYVCHDCNYTIGAEEYRDTLDANISYTCKCGHSGGIKVPFKRNKVSILNPKTGKKKRKMALVFNCSKCNSEIIIVSDVRGAK